MHSTAAGTVLGLLDTIGPTKALEGLSIPEEDWRCALEGVDITMDGVAGQLEEWLAPGRGYILTWSPGLEHWLVSGWGLQMGARARLVHDNAPAVKLPGQRGQYYRLDRGHQYRLRPVAEVEAVWELVQLDPA